MGSLNDLSGIIEENTVTKDESYTVKESYQKRVEGGFLRQAASFLTFGLIDDHTYETAYRDKRIEKYVDYVDMEEVASDYLQPIQKKLEEIKKQTVKHALDETNRLKEFLKKELVKIDNLLDEKLRALYQIEDDSKATAAEIKRKEDNLKWLEGIQERVDSLIEF
jgi:galactokinase